MLDHIEWVRINDIILIINSTNDIDTMRKYFFEAIKMLIPYEKAMFYFLIEERNTLKMVKPIFVNVDSAFAKAYENTVNQGRYGRVAMNLHKSIAYKDTDLMPDAIRTNTDVYQSFLLPYDVPYGGGIVLANKGVLISEITFFRTKTQGDFTEKEVYIWDILKEHLALRMIRESSSVNDLMNSKSAKLTEFGLTNREIEIVWLIVNNYSTVEVSDKLNISIFTTKKHLNNIFVKLDINNRLQLMQLFSGL